MADIIVHRSSSSRPANASGEIFRDAKHGVVVVTGQTARFFREDGLSFGLDDDTGWLATLTCRAATEEEAAPILAAEAREQAELEAAHARAEAKRKLFAPEDGEYQRGEQQFRLDGLEIPWDVEGRIYGSGEWFVVVDAGPHAGLWHVVNNGHDGDDWSVSNVQTGGAGAIGRRFEPTPERLAFLRSLPGGEQIGKTKGERRRDALLAYHELLTRVPAWAEEYADPRLVEMRANRDAMVAFLNGDEPVDAVRPQPCVWTKIGGQLVGMALDGSSLVVQVDTSPDMAPRPYEFDIYSSGRRVYLAYPPTPERVTAVRGRWPSWVGSAAPGRYVVGYDVADNGADALQLAACRGVAVEEVHVVPGAAIACIAPENHKPGQAGTILWSDGGATRVGSLTRLWSRARERAALQASVAERDAKGEKVYDHERENLVGPDVWAGPGFPAVPAPPAPTATLSAVAAELVRVALGSKTWREGRRYSRLLDVVSEDRALVAEHDRKGYSSGEEGKLFRLTLKHEVGLVEDLWLLRVDWWAMGEDGDAGTDLDLFEHEAEARAAFEKARAR